METLIVICLLLIIILLLQNKSAVPKRKMQKPTVEKMRSDLPDIMGKAKPIRSISVPKNAPESHIRSGLLESANFDIENEHEVSATAVSEEELDAVFSSMPDLEEEEEEWNRYGISGGNDGFAQGVTFEELSSVGMLLQQDKLEPFQKETTVAVVQKIQGTELFILLENSVESASRKIAELLDGRLSSTTDFAISSLQKIDKSNFDIGDFV